MLCLAFKTPDLSAEQRDSRPNGHKRHHVWREGEGDANGEVNLACDHQHDFGHGDQTIPARVAQDDAQLLRGQKNPVACDLEVDDEYNRDEGDTGLPRSCTQRKRRHPGYRKSRP